jgi:hypothetical protein
MHGCPVPGIPNEKKDTHKQEQRQQQLTSGFCGGDVAPVAFALVRDLSGSL